MCRVTPNYLCVTDEISSYIRALLQWPPSSVRSQYAYTIHGYAFLKASIYFP